MKMEECFSSTWANSTVDAQNEVVMYDTDESETLTDQNVPVYTTESQATAGVLKKNAKENSDLVKIEKWNKNCPEEIVVEFEGALNGDAEIPFPNDQDEYIAAKPYYICKFCSRTFKRKATFINHMASHQKSDKKYDCEICGLRYIESCDLLQHFKSHKYIPKSRIDIDYYFKALHKKSFVCQYCGMAFDRKKALLSHARIHGGNTPLACQKCNQGFWDMRSMEDHWNIKHTDFGNEENFSKEANTKRPYSCTICGISFCTLKNWKNHQKEHTEDESINNAELEVEYAEVEHGPGFDYRCNICGEDFIDGQTRAEHVRGHHPKEKDLKCVTCSESFSYETKLNKHQLSHQKQVFSCDMCAKEFQDERTLMNHQHTHRNNSDRQYPCRECGKLFASKGTLNIHTRIHTGERPYGCSFCHKAFSDGGTLRKHVRVHTGEKPYECVVCQRAFSQRVVLRDHIKAHHSSRYKNIMDPYLCFVCPNMLHTSQDLIDHLIDHCDSNTAKKRLQKKYLHLKRSGYQLLVDSSSYEKDDDQVQEKLQTTEAEKAPDYKIETVTSLTKRSRKSSTEQYLMQFDTNIDEELPCFPSSVVELPCDHSGYAKQGFNSNGYMLSLKGKITHAQKTKGPMKNDGLKSNKNKTITRTNISNHILKSERLPVATSSEGMSAVSNLLSRNQPIEEEKNKFDELCYTDQVGILDVAMEETVQHNDFSTEKQQPSSHFKVEEEISDSIIIKQEEYEEQILCDTPEEYVISEANIDANKYPIISLQEDLNIPQRKENIDSSPHLDFDKNLKIKEEINEDMLIIKEEQYEEQIVTPEVYRISDANPDSNEYRVITMQEYRKRSLDQNVSERKNTTDSSLLDLAQNLKVDEEISGDHFMIKQKQFEEKIVYATPEKDAISKANPDGNEYSVITMPEYQKRSVDRNIIERKKSIVSSSLLEFAEISMQHGQSLVKCEMCNTVFSDKSQLLAHVSIHI